MRLCSNKTLITKVGTGQGFVTPDGGLLLGCGMCTLPSLAGDAKLLPKSVAAVDEYVPWLFEDGPIPLLCPW